MSLCKVVQFKSLIDTLDCNEFDSFLSEFISLYGKRSIITKALFHLFVNESKNNCNDYESNANQIIKNIIDKREPTNIKNETILTAPTYLVIFNDLPSIMISNIASYLFLFEVTNFALCNRHSYISSKSITTSITSIINPNWFTNYCSNYGSSSKELQIQRLYQFRRVKHLVFVPWDIEDQFSSTEQWIWPRLHTFIIPYAQMVNDENDKQLSRIVESMDIKHFYCNDIQVTTLRHYLEFVCSNKNIEYLTLDSVSVHQNQFEDADILALFSTLSKLKGIAFNNNDENQDMLFKYIIANHLSKQLQSLHIHSEYSAHHQENTLYSWKEQKYSELEELCMSGQKTEYIEDIVESATNLRRFCWYPVVVGPMKNEVKVLRILLLNESLEYLTINTSFVLQFMAAICASTFDFLAIPDPDIDKFIDELVDIPKRKCFKLILRASDEMNRNDVVDEVGNRLQENVNFIAGFVDILRFLVAEEFIILIQCRLDSVLGNKIQSEIECIKKKYKTYYTTEKGNMNGEFELITFAICNHDNKMGGYRYTEAWNMPCTCFDNSSSRGP